MNGIGGLAMSSQLSFVEHICDQARDAAPISFRKMFGEYAIYQNGKVVALVCDDQLFLKPTTAARTLLPAVVESPPYPGAKPCLVISDFVDDRGLLSQLFRITSDALPAPKPKTRRRAKSPRKAK
jgi:TfoX/Sxy family transcriptional regulator of competence genes